MHKLYLRCLLATISIFLLLFVPISKADNSSPWTTSALNFQKQADTQAIPNSLNGNIDCYSESDTICAVPTVYGAASQNGGIRLNSSGKYTPVLSYIDGQQRFIPIPNSDEFMTLTTEPPYGVYLYFNYDLLGSIKKTTLFGHDAYQVQRPPDGVLQDKSGKRLAADTSSMSFSPNGQWMVVSSPNIGVLRVNLQTFEALPFAPGFDYSVGLDPAPKTAITNDGRYALVASKNFSRFRIYDLQTCEPIPDVINAPATCQNRDLSGFMQQNLAGFSFISYARFIDENSFAAYATYAAGNSTKTVRVIVSTGPVENQIDLLALGDSYISGEGVFNYQGGTDTETNTCHVSLISYPYLVGRDLNFSSYHSLACSGATTNDILNTQNSYKGQADKKSIRRDERLPKQIDSIFNSFLPGYIDQLDFVTKYQPKTVLLSVGGNDMGFSQIVKDCALSPGTCYGTYEDRLELVRQINYQVYPRLLQTYAQLLAAGAPDMHLYVVGYPQIAKPDGSCGLNVRLNSDEITFSQQLVAYLDSIIQKAAAKTSAYYVDTQAAFTEHRLCEAGPGSVAMNGLTAGNNIPTRLGGPIGNESYHPNDFGHQLLENDLLISTHKLSLPMPAANANTPGPTETGLDILNAPRSGREIKTIQYDPDIFQEQINQGDGLNISVDGQKHGLAPGSLLQAEVHSTPVSLGSFTTDSSGNLDTQISLPPQLEPGYHSIHFYGSDINGQNIDIYKFINIVAQDSPTTQAAAESTASNNEVTTQPTATISSSLTTKPPGTHKANATNQTAAPSQVLGESIAESPTANRFNPFWLLAALPASLSIFYFVRSGR